MLRTITRNIARTHVTNARAFTAASLPDLPYDFGALEPVLDGAIMELHHQKHHKTYVTNFNAAQEKYAEAELKGDYEGMIALQPALKFNGGGHVNHSLFWKCLTAPKDYALPEGELLAMIDRDFGSLSAMQDKFTASTVAVQGSGWGWLGYNKATGKLAVTTTANQDPCITTGLTPVLGVDVWEHAYYLQYKNLRPDYVKNIWKIINWKVRQSRRRGVIDETARELGTLFQTKNCILTIIRSAFFMRTGSQQQPTQSDVKVTFKLFDFYESTRAVVIWLKCTVLHITYLRTMAREHFSRSLLLLFITINVSRIITVDLFELKFFIFASCI